VATHIIELAQDPDIEMGKVAECHSDLGLEIFPGEVPAGR
jgi:hypothetical protein